MKCKLGDIYAVKLPDSRYGAIRVIDIIDDTFLIYTTKFINFEVPSINDKDLKEVLLQNRFYFENEPSMQWVEGDVPKELIHIGNIPVCKYEKTLECSIYSGVWGPWCANDVYLEWRWLNDREKFESEINGLQNSTPELLIESELMIDTKFWSIIDLLDFNCGEEDKIIHPAVLKLSKLNEGDILSFEETLSLKLYLLDTINHAENIGEYSYRKGENSYFSEDLFLYARCYVVAKGKDFFGDVVKDPKKMPQNNEFEALLTISERAYFLKTNKELNHISKYDYETFSNVVGWKISK